MQPLRKCSGMTRCSKKKKIEIAFVANSTSKTRNSNLRGMGSRKTFYGKVGITKTRPAIIPNIVENIWFSSVQLRAIVGPSSSLLRWFVLQWRRWLVAGPAPQHWRRRTHTKQLRYRGLHRAWGSRVRVSNIIFFSVSVKLNKSNSACIWQWLCINQQQPFT